MNGIALLRSLNRLATRRGWDFSTKPAKGGHMFVRMNGRSTTVPQHRKDLATGTFRAILKQLGITETDLET